ncbi:MAG: alpha/beta hydrolase, partial [Pseudomonadota bacterium]
MIGKPDAPQTIVFIHGFSSDQEAWRFITNGFKDHYRLVLFDTMGCGVSDISEFSALRYSSLEGHADDFIQILDALDLRKTIVIAHSVSSMVAVSAKLKRPDLFARLVMIAATP